MRRPSISEHAHPEFADQWEDLRWFQERDELQSRINQKIIETEEIRHERDGLNKKVWTRDKQQDELQADNVKLANELRDTHDTVKKVRNNSPYWSIYIAGFRIQL